MSCEWESIAKIMNPRDSVDISKLDIKGTNVKTLYMLDILLTIKRQSVLLFSIKTKKLRRA